MKAWERGELLWLLLERRRGRGRERESVVGEVDKKIPAFHSILTYSSFFFGFFFYSFFIINIPFSLIAFFFLLSMFTFYMV